MFRRQSRSRHHYHQAMPPQHYPYTPQQPYSSQMAPSYGQPFMPQQPQGPTPFEPSLTEISQLDRLEREIIEINRRINNLSRRLRRIEDHLNIHD